MGVRRDQTLGAAAAFATVLIWSAVYGGKELLLGRMSPVELVFFQYLLAAPAIALLAAVRRERLWLPLRDMAAVWGSGILGIALFQLAVNVGIQLVGSVPAAIFSGLLPTCALLAAVVLERRRPDGRQLLSVLASTAGILLVTGTSAGDRRSLPGYLILLASNFLWVAFCHLNKRLQETGRVSGLALVFHQSLATALVLLPVTLAGGGGGAAALARPDALGLLLFLALGNAVLAYLLLNYALQRLDVVVCNIIFNFVPVVTIAFNAVLLGQGVALGQLLGAGLIVSSVLIPAKRPE